MLCYALFQDYSLIIMQDGQSLAVGNNYKHKISGTFPYDKKDHYIEFGMNLFFLPVETTITSNATFCIAGANVSVVCSGIIPSNCPNRVITEDRTLELPMSIFEAKQKIEE